MALNHQDNGPARLSAGVVVIRGDAPAHRYLLLRARDYWDFPKGLVEPGEAPLAAAIREVEEETTLTALGFRWGEAFHETARYGHNKIARYYLAESLRGEVRLPVSAELGHPEHDEFRWLAFGEARRLLVPRVQAVLDWAEAIVRGDR
jgi:bis(5'-nucleosidyl)-tetraphosphatase